MTWTELQWYAPSGNFWVTISAYIKLLQEENKTYIDIINYLYENYIKENDHVQSNNQN